MTIRLDMSGNRIKALVEDDGRGFDSDQLMQGGGDDSHTVARLLRLQPGESEEARKRWRDWARRQRYFSYVMAGLIGVIAFLMSTKPSL